MNPKISVIVPIFGTEKYLDKCLSSVINQTFENIEIICVDDCSPDDSYKIVEKYSAKDNRVSLLRHEKNLGLGGARNTAIRVARGEYLASVDSDDSMMPNMLETLWKATEGGWFDVVCCGFNRVDGAGNIQNYQIYPAESIVNDENDINIFTTLNPAFWNKLWRKTLFTENDIFFPDGDYFEDMPTTPCVLSKARYIKVIEDRLYQYFIRSGSITTTYSARHIIDYFKGFEILLRFLEDNKLVERYKNDFFDYVNSGLRYHSDNVVGSNMNKVGLEQYFRHLLMFKIAFLENRDLLKYKNIGELLELIKQRALPSALEQKKKILNETENEKEKAYEVAKKYQNLLTLKEEEVSKYEKKLDTIKEDIAQFQEETAKYKQLLELSHQENNQLKEEVLKFRQSQDSLFREKISIQEEASKYKEMLQVLEQEKIEALSSGQALGVLIFSVFIRLFLTKGQFLKLKKNPRLFFKDSKNSFTRLVGSFLGVI